MMTAATLPEQQTGSEARAGLIAASTAYVWWGLLPIYLKIIGFADVREVLAVRILICVPASLLALFALNGFARGFGELRRALRPRMLGTLACSALCIFGNWGIYVWLIAQGRVIESSLAYFLTPLVTVAVGVALFGERVGKIQIAALAFAVAGVVVQGLAVGAPPWMALALCATWSAYGIIRKRAAVQAAVGLVVETVILTPLAVGLLFWVASAAPLSFTHSWGEGALLSLAGPVTALPLMLFAYGARRVSFATLGLLQYIAPTLQFLTGLAYGEHFTLLRGVSFGLIWLGLVLFTWNAIRRSRAA
jgi:chloramphenicol-sensitive protein RarD